MTRRELDRRMDYAELVDWMALEDIRADEREAAARQQKKGMRPR